MTDEPLWGYQAFEDGLAYLKRLGHEVTSPHNLDIANGFTEVVAWWDIDQDHYNVWVRDFQSVQLTERFSREAAMRLDIAAILKVDAISMLPGWEKSEGARNEVAVAKMLGLPIYRHKPWSFFEYMDEWAHDDVKVAA